MIFIAANTDSSIGDPKDEDIEFLTFKTRCQYSRYKGEKTN